MANVENSKSALLVMDIQQIMKAFLSDTEQLLQNVGSAIEAARNAGIPVIYVKVGFRPGYPEIHPGNERFSQVKQSGGMLVLTEQATDIDPAVKPLDSEVVVTKKRFSAFAGNDLEMILRSQGITHLLLSGFSTSGVVLSTLREAADKDFKLTVLSDCCADPDKEVHEFLVKKIFPMQAAILESAAWIASIKS